VRSNSTEQIRKFLVVGGTLAGGQRQPPHIEHMNGCVSVLTAVVIAAFPLTTLTATPTPGASGIEGVISVSPSRPGPVRIDQPSAAPAGNVVFTVKRADERVASFATDAAGRFHVPLPPGHYVVLREDVGARIGGWRFEADVANGNVTKVQWTGDSGMR
jgi:hypothetical protein